MRLNLHGRIQAKVVEVAGHSALLHIGVELHAEGQLEGLRDRAEGTRQLGEGSAVVRGLCGVDGGVELMSIVSDFAQRMDARAEFEHLSALAGTQARKRRFRHLLGLIEAAGGAHAERIVDGQHGDFTVVLEGKRVLFDVGMRKSKREQEEQQRAKREENQIAQAAVLDGALRTLLEEHERAERQGLRAVLAQEVKPHGQTYRERAGGKEPGSEQSHL